jgi:hypothetical protein
MLRNDKGLFVKARTSETAESPPEGEGEGSPESWHPGTEGEGDRLAEYRDQSRQLADARAKVQAIHEETASLTMTRDAALSRRQELLNSWVESANEASVEELSKLGARAEVFEAKLQAQAGKLAVAEAELKRALDTFERSFRNLHSALQNFLSNAALEHLMSLVHPDVRIRAKALCSEVAWLTTPVVNAAPLRIATQADHYSIPGPADILLLAGRSLPKAEALLAECVKHEGFVPPEAYTEERWRATVAAATAAEAKAQQERAAKEAERTARPNPHAVTERGSNSESLVQTAN